MQSVSPTDAIENPDSRQTQAQILLVDSDAEIRKLMKEKDSADAIETMPTAAD